MEFSNYPTKGSSAYDLSLFEGRTVDYSRERREAARKNTAQKTKKQSAANASARKRIDKATAERLKNRFYCIAFGVVAFCSLSIMVFTCLRQYEVTKQIDEAKAQLELLRQDNEALNMAFETGICGPALEDYAVNVLGMQKLEGFQTECITIGGGDVFECNEDYGEETWLQEQIDRFLAYLN